MPFPLAFTLPTSSSPSSSPLPLLPHTLWDLSKSHGVPIATAAPIMGSGGCQSLNIIISQLLLCCRQERVMQAREDRMSGGGGGQRGEGGALRHSSNYPPAHLTVLPSNCQHKHTLACSFHSTSLHERMTACTAHSPVCLCSFSLHLSPWRPLSPSIHPPPSLSNGSATRAAQS